MLLDLVNIALLLPLAYYAWKQQGEIDDLKMMVGYVLTLVDDEEEDNVLHDQ
jgi:hypothetical protein